MSFVRKGKERNTVILCVLNFTPVPEKITNWAFPRAVTEDLKQQCEKHTEEVDREILEAWKPLRCLCMEGTTHFR